MVVMSEFENLLTRGLTQGRRDFLKTTGAIGGALATGFPAILSGAPAAKTLKVGLVGCGGRGTGAAAETRGEAEARLLRSALMPPLLLEFVATAGTGSSGRP